MSAQGGVLTRRASLNQPKPPPPVRRSSSITAAPNPAVLQKYRSSPPRQLGQQPGLGQGQVQGHQYRQDQKPSHRRSRSASGSEPAYAELTEIQQSIQARYQQQELYEQRTGNQSGQYLQTGNSQIPVPSQSSAPVTPQYALPVTIPSSQSQYSTSVVDTLNAKFAAMNKQMGQNSQSCPQFVPQGGIGPHSDALPPPPPASEDFPDLPPPPTEAELRDIEHTYNVPNVDKSQVRNIQTIDHSRQDSQTVELRRPPQTSSPPKAPKPTGDMRQSLITEMKRGNMFRKMSYSEDGSEC